MRPNGSQPPSRRNPSVLVASSWAGIRQRWRGGLDGRFRTLEAGGYADLERGLVRFKPDALVVDALLLPVDGIGAVRRWSSATRVLLMVGALNEAEAISVLKAGARGYHRRDGDAALVRQAVEVVQKGGVSIEGRAAARVIEELRATEGVDTDPKGHVNGELDGLTSREHEVARFIADGARNKEIANQLHITEATVKAHLTKVFRKLGLPDRLHLGLLLSRVSASRASGLPSSRPSADDSRTGAGPVAGARSQCSHWRPYIRKRVSGPT